MASEVHEEGPKRAFESNFEILTFTLRLIELKQRHRDRRISDAQGPATQSLGKAKVVICELVPFLRMRALGFIWALDMGFEF